MASTPLSMQDSLPLLYQSALLEPYAERLIHGFTGKPWSFGGPDTPVNPRQGVLDHRERFHKALGLTQPWQIPEQVHGHRVGRAGDTALCQTDAMALFTPDIPVMLLFADCVPILLYDPVTHSGAVIHAGWRGTAQNIVQEAILTFQNAKGVKPQDIRAVIGPAISLCCFQVSLTVAQQLGASLDQELEALTQKGLIVWDEAFPENPRVNLKAINAAQLEAFGVKHCDVLPQCTYCEAEQLFSFRRGEDGRNSAYMMLKSK